MPKKALKRKFLFILDPLDHLDPRWDTSLSLAQEFIRRGHQVWYCDQPDLWFEHKKVYGRVRRMSLLQDQASSQEKPVSYALDVFDMVLIRKEPPFDLNYLYLTYLLDLVPPRVIVTNSPSGIRNVNEKLSSLNFAEHIPETLVTSDPEIVLNFQKRLRSDLILKPLNLKGGQDIVLLRKKEPKAQNILGRLFRENNFAMAQRFIRGEKNVFSDKRILLLRGDVLAAYEKKPKAGDFRGNLSLGATYHPAKIDSQDRRVIARIRPYLKKNGLFFVGLDVLKGRLIEINVTCPAGISEAEILYPKLRLAAKWADYLENLLLRRAW